ncbi:unnamed protein product [Ceratitis capitata]|uniref:DNA polymerase eta n=1 Tax=Ceratitis capitata TaxID=7213 RepID=A0A811V536_CERCA|nr:unnamed protein product [Ceratitis capitata]
MSSRNSSAMQQKYSRVVVLVDMDCFFCQVEEKLNPQLKGQPVAVVQYNAWRGGGIIAVNYAARAKGVTRHMRGDEAKEKCAEIQLVTVPNMREKADTSRYREAGKEVANVLQRFTPLLERASVDEAYMDITEAVNKRLGDMNAGSFMLQPQGLINTFAVGYAGIGDFLNVITKRLNEPTAEDIESQEFGQAHDAVGMAAVRQSDIRLLIGAAIAGEVRAAVKAETGYECSAGIAHNKILAKLACGINKPNKQTILPLAQIPKFFETLPLTKIQGLGGKFGEKICVDLQIRYLGELLPYSEPDLQRKFDEKNGTWLYNICRGIDLEPVTPRFYSKSIGCCKKFPGRNNITGLNTLRHWLGELASEVCERMEKDMLENNRRAKQMVVSFIQEFDGEEVSSSRSAPLNAHDQETLAKCSLEVLQANTKQFLKSGNTLALNNPIKFLGISVGKFETIQSGQGKLQEMFANLAAKKKTETENGLRQASGAVNSVASSNHPEPVAKKPTFMQNFLRRSTEASASEESKNSTNEKCSQNVDEILECDDDENVTGAIKSDYAVQEVQQTPTVRSFFLNALKNRSVNESKETASTLDVASTDDCSLNTNMAVRESDITKSFFAKVLKRQADVEITDTIQTKQHNKLQYSPEKSQTSAIVSNSDDKIEQLAVVLQEYNEENDEEHHVSCINMAENIGPSKNKRKYSALLQSESSTIETTAHDTTSASYETSYAEFAVPELRTDLIQMIKCDTCKADIPSDARSVQLHQDRHIAMQLSQQLRDEYRTEVKTQLSAKKPANTPVVPSKKPKKSPVQATKIGNSKAGTSITKFLKPTAAAATTVVAATTSVPTQPPTEIIDLSNDTVDTAVCEECKLTIPTSELEEHKDFHVAKTLQRQLNMLEVRTVSVAKKSNAPCNGTLNASQASIKNIKPITQFFSQSNCL